jgi:hypothetical protein
MIMMMITCLSSSKSTDWNRTCCFGVRYCTRTCGTAGSATLKPSDACTCCVVVGWGWAVAFVALMTTAEPELNDSGEEEDETV